jgi:hypothetical protein
MMSPPDDPWVSAQIDAALAPYAGRVSAEELAWMREQLAEVLASDAHAARLVRGAHPEEPTVEESGEVVRGRAPKGREAPANDGRGGRTKAG